MKEMADRIAHSNCRQHIRHVMGASIAQAFVFKLWEKIFPLVVGAVFKKVIVILRPTIHMSPLLIHFCPWPAGCLRHFETDLKDMLQTFMSARSLQPAEVQIKAQKNVWTQHILVKPTVGSHLKRYSQKLCALEVMALYLYADKEKERGYMWRWRLKGKKRARPILFELEL